MGLIKRILKHWLPVFIVKRGSWVVFCWHRYLSCVNKLGRNRLMLFFSADRAKSSFNGPWHAIPIKWTIEEHLFKLLDHWFQIIKFYSLVQQKPFWWLIDLFIGSNWIAEVGTSALLNVASMTINNLFFCYLAILLTYFCVHALCLTLRQMVWLGFFP